MEVEKKQIVDFVTVSYVWQYKKKVLTLYGFLLTRVTDVFTMFGVGKLSTSGQVCHD